MKRIIVKNPITELINSVFWKKQGENVGLLLASVFVLAFILWAPFNAKIFIMASSFALVFYFKISCEIIEIDSHKIIFMWSLFCWGMVSWGIFLLEDVENFLPARILLVALLAEFLYYFIPQISFGLKYTTSADNEFCTYGEKVFLGFVWIIIFYVVDCQEVQRQADDRSREMFMSESFVPVKLMSVEEYNGDTYYVLKAKDTIFWISPVMYPKVRYINENSQVKVIFAKKSDLTIPQRIEFKNVKELHDN